MMPHFVLLPHSQETFLIIPPIAGFKKLIQTIRSFIIIGLLQQKMKSSCPSGGTPKKFVPGKRQSFNLIFHSSILTLTFSTLFR